MRSIICSILFIFLWFDSFSQLQVTPSNNANTLAQTLAGQGVTITNAALNCSGISSLGAPTNPSGTFVGTASNIGIAGGVLLTTGDVSYAVGPNATDADGDFDGGTFNDPDLMAIEPLAIYDVCILEFDARPSCDTLAFTFAFGSEEYNEFVGSLKNDAFGIFVTGTNPSGPNYNAYNMALIPSTTTPVAINNVNNGDDGFLGCPSVGPCTNCAYYIDNCNGTTVEYDGFTRPITVRLPVVPCGSYHFKLAIADADDWVYDSGVFFARQSLTCNTTLTILTSSNPATCTANNGTATANVTAGGAPPYTYSWSTTPVQNTATATGLAPGTYTVNVVDANGCISGTATVAVTSNGGFSFTSTSTNVSCAGNDGSATITPTGGTPPYTYIWNPAGQTTSSISNLSVGSYTCLITDATGCSQTTTVGITQSAGTVSGSITSFTNVGCTGGNTGSATASASGGANPYTYVWNTTPAQTGATASNLGPGNYIVTITDANSCATTQSVTITQSAGLVLTPGQINISCFGNNNASASVIVSGGVPPYTYLWSTTPPQVTPAVSGLSAGSYTCLVTDASGCTQTSTYTITQPTAVTGSITATANISCFNANDGSATASGNGGTPPISYSWNTAPVQITATATNLAPGNYVVTIRDVNNCIITRSVTITQPAAMSSTTSSTACGCGMTNGTATITQSGGTTPYTYLWLTSPVQTAPTASGLVAGTYTIIVSDVNGCANAQSVIVPGVAAPVADFSVSPSDVVDFLDPLTAFTDLSSASASSWSWNFGDPVSGANDSSSLQHPTHIYADTGVHCITLIVSDPTNMCKDTSIKCLRVEAPFTFYVPNTFTPNNDGFNELFLAYGTYIKEFKMMVFDRWGNKIFESNSLYEGWNGKVKNEGNLVQEDVYVWKVRLKDSYGKNHTYVGHVTMLK